MYYAVIEFGKLSLVPAVGCTHKVKIEWFRPVFPEDTLTSDAVVANLTRKNERSGIVEIVINAFNEKGENVLKATTEALVKCK